MEDGTSDPEKSVSLSALTALMDDFANARDWGKFHTPRNLLLALVGEVGELSEIFQWKGEVTKGLPGWSDEEREHLGEELSDVLLYLVRLADICNVNLSEASLKKMEKNSKKYPIEKCKGLSDKYTTYLDHDAKSEGGQPGKDNNEVGVVVARKAEHELESIGKAKGNGEGLGKAKAKVEVRKPGKSKSKSQGRKRKRGFGTSEQ